MFTDIIFTLIDESNIKNEDEMPAIGMRGNPNGDQVKSSKKITEGIQQLKKLKLEKRSKFFSDKLKAQQGKTTMVFLKI